MKLQARTELQLQNIIGEMRQMFKRSGFVEADIRDDKKRSLDQNGQAHVWYQQIANELREGTVLEVKCECKLTLGVPILRAESDDFRTEYDTLIKTRYSYEEKLRVMQWFPVTSLMTTDQLNQYLTAMQTAYAGRVALEFLN